MAQEWVLFNRGPTEPTLAEHLLEQKLRTLFKFDLDEVERNPHGETAENFRSFMVSHVPPCTASELIHPQNEVLGEVQPTLVNDVVDHLAEMCPIISSVSNPFDVAPVNAGGNSRNAEHASANASEIAELVSTPQTSLH